MGSDLELTTDNWLFQPPFHPDWERSKLYSSADWLNGLAFRGKQFSSNGLPVIKIAEIKNGISGQTKYTEEIFGDAYLLKKGDFLFCWSGQPETSIDTFRWQGPEGWLNQHIFKVVPKPEILPDYFFYILKYLKPNFIQIASNKQTTGLGHVTKTNLKEIEIAFPPLPEQKAIAHILGTLDDKIELNRRMNATLEGMAQALFKSWFVDFDPVIDNALAAGNPIPDELAPRAEVRRKILGERSSSCVTSTKDGAGAPSLPDNTQQDPLDHPTLSDPKSLFPDAFQFTEELGWIPEGWEVGCISDLAELNPESWTAKKHPDSVNYVDLANTKDGRINETSAYEFWEAPSRARRVLKQHDTIIGTVRPGNRSFAYIHEDGLTGSTGFAVLRANKVASRSFIYLGLTRDEIIEVFAHLADGAAYPAIRPEVVGNTRIAIPGSAVLQSFEDMAAPLIAKVGQHQKESETLSSLRDTLLPKLISGDLRTSASENSTA